MLILASTSSYRRALLDRLRVPYRAEPHTVDERRDPPPGLTPDALAAWLAEAKARSVATGSDFVLGSDQLVDLDGAVLGKPGTVEAAEAQLARLSGRAHRLVTAQTLLTPDGRAETVLDVHVLTLRALSAQEIERYVAADAPLDCAGSYKIESLGIALVERIEGGDFTAIVGLSLRVVAGMLRRAGFQVP